MHIEISPGTFLCRVYMYFSCMHEFSLGTFIFSYEQAGELNVCALFVSLFMVQGTSLLLITGDRHQTRPTQQFRKILNKCKKSGSDRNQTGSSLTIDVFDVFVSSAGQSDTFPDAMAFTANETKIWMSILCYLLGFVMTVLHHILQINVLKNNEL